MDDCNKLCSVSASCRLLKRCGCWRSLRWHKRKDTDLTQNQLFPLHPIKTNRDTLIFKLPNNGALVVGCDSAGGIGPKRLDKIKVDAFTLGKFTARAALMDVLAVGAHPICIVDTLAVEPKPTGNEILRGIRAEAEKAGLDPKLAVTGSTEKNIKVDQTGIGVTVIGTCPYKHLKIGSSKPNDIVAALGVPCVGEEVLPAEKTGQIADTVDVLMLRSGKFIHELIPVGSTGIKRETQTLAEGSNLRAAMLHKHGIDLEKSAGPATVVLATLAENNLENLSRLTKKPIAIVARLRALP
jgi:hypothetical protein